MTMLDLISRERLISFAIMQRNHFKYSK